MSNQDERANVVLEADVSGYSAGMTQATQQTNALAGAIDSLSQRLDGITKRAGKKLILFGTADLAALTGATAVAANYEKQLKTLEASLTKGKDGIRAYSTAVNQLARDLPIARGEAASLATQLNSMGTTTAKETGKIADSMVKLSAATGESLTGLTAGMVQLNRQMGTLGSGSGAFKNFSDSLTTISQAAGVSAEGVLQFAQNIAPFARAAGIGQKELMGISAAFTQAGADGYAAANTFNTMVSDITRSITSGSPDIAKYSNLIGVTVEQFNKMDATDRIVEIFEAINKQGPNAIKTLDRLGYDGIRAAKAIQAVTQSGQMRSLIGASQAGYGSGATDEAAAKAFDNIDATMQKIKNNTEQMAASIGSGLVAPANSALSVFNKVLETINQFAAPLMKIGGILGAGLGVVAIAGGGIAASMGMLSKMATMAFFGNSTPVRSALGGLRAGFGGATGNIPTTGWAGQTVDRYTSGQMRWYQRPFFEGGMALGNAFGGASGGRNLLGQMLAKPFQGATWLAQGSRQFYETAGTVNPWDRRPGFLAGVGDTATRLSGSLAGFRGSMGAPTAAASQAAAQAAMAKSAQAAALANEKYASTTAQVTAAARRLAIELGKTGAAAAAAGVKNTAALAGSAIGGIGKLGMGLVGGPLGVALLGGLGLATYMGNEKERRASALDPNLLNPISEYNAKLGLATDTVQSFTATVADSAKKIYVTTSQALNDMAAAAKKAAADPNVVGGGARNLDSSNRGAGLAYLRSMTGLNTNNANEVTADLIRVYGLSGTQDIMSQYNTASGSTFGQADITSLMDQARGNNTGPSKYWKGGVTDATTGAITNIVGGIDTASATAAEKYGLKAGYQTNASMTRELLKQAFDPTTDTETRTEIIRQLEKSVFGGELKWGENKTGIDWIDERLGGNAELNVDSFYNEFLPSSEVGKRYLENQRAQGVNFDLGIAGSSALNRTQTNPVTQAIMGTRLGSFAKTNRTVYSALGESSGNQSAQVNAYNALATNAIGTGSIGSIDPSQVAGAFGGAVKGLQDLKAAVQSTSDPLYQMAMAAGQVVSAFMQFKMGEQSRSQRYGTIGATTAAVLNGPATPENAQERQQAAQERIGASADYRDYLKGLIMAHVQFKRQMARSEEDYRIQTERANSSFYRQMQYAEEDYYRQREYNQQDFARNMARSAEDAAKSVYNPWDRVYSQLTTGAGNVSLNLEDQNKMLQEQMANLQRLKKAGVSQQVIDTMDLANPQNSQQLQAFTDEILNNPALIKRINAQIQTRLGLTKKLTQSAFNQSYRRALEDFELSGDRAETAFQTSMERAKTQFGITMGQMGEDHKRSMQRAKTDLSLYGEEIYGTMTTLHRRAVGLIAGNLGKTGDAVIESLNKIKKEYPWLFDPSIPLPASTPTEGTDAGRRNANADRRTASNTADPTGSSRPTAKPPGRSSTSIRTQTNNNSNITVNHNYNVKTGPVQASDPTALAREAAKQARIKRLMRAGAGN